MFLAAKKNPRVTVQGRGAILKSEMLVAKKTYRGHKKRVWEENQRKIERKIYYSHNLKLLFSRRIFFKILKKNC